MMKCVFGSRDEGVWEYEAVRCDGDERRLDGD
jgi:hypothetical protein